MIRVIMVATALVSSGTAAAQERLSDYVRGIYEERCLKEDVSACSDLINAGGVPDATRARALAIRGTDRLRKDAVDRALPDLKGALEIAEATQDPAMARLDAMRGVAGFTPAWRSSVHARLSDALMRSGDKPAARTAVEKAIVLDPRNGLAYSMRARLAGSEEKWPVAMADFDKALRIGIDDKAELGRTYYLRALVRGALEQPEQAQLADFSSAIATDPGFALAYERRGDLYNRLGRYEEALRDYDALTVRAPDYGAGFNSACWTRAAYLRREFDKARSQCDRAVALAPEPNNYDSAGLVALQQQRWQDAWTFYDKAVKGDAKMASALYGRGIAAKRLGRTAEATADLAAAQKLDAKVASAFVRYGQTP